MKNYPSRVHDSSVLDSTIVGVCECGHADYHHHFTGIGSNAKDECTDCLCENYKEEQKMTQRESMKLRDYIDNKNGNFSQ